MLKLFRNSGQNTSINKRMSRPASTAGRYLKYAFGEIILVVLGILIALSINNWNETSKEQHRESLYLKNLERDLNDQISSIDLQITYETRFVKDAVYIINQYHEKGLKNLNREFFSKLSNLQSRKTFVITDPTYTDLLSSGNINLINTQNLKDQLIQYYQQLELIEKVIQNNNSLLTDQQYGSVFFNLGYFHIENTLNAHRRAKDPSLDHSFRYSDELARTSENLLSLTENKLKLMNVVNLRHEIGLTHLEVLRRAKSQTETLLNVLKGGSRN